MRYDGLKQVRRALGAAFLIATLAACSDFISPIESNPNAVGVATVDQLFTGIQVNTWFFGEGQLSRLSAMWTQQMTGTDRQFATLDAYTFDETDGDDSFYQLYTFGGLVDLKQAIAKAEEADRRAYAGILKIHQAYLFGMGASVWGDLPYSEAVNPEIAAPALDEQADVYAAVQALLDAALADLSAGGAGPGAVDQVFGGDVPSWTAVAHTLKARFHMHWAEVDPGRYAQALAQAESGIKSASMDWKGNHTTTSTENNTWFQFIRDRSGYIAAGDYLLPMMVNDGDPRLPVYYSTVGGQYIPASVGGGEAASLLSTTGYGASSWDFPLVTCAENYFIIAEAQQHAGSNTAAIAAAKSALGCEEARLGVTLTAAKAAFDGLSGAALLNEIMDQKYTALFLNPESWNDYKRTCRPAITPRDPLGVPARLYYGQTERQTNPNIPTTAQQAGGHGVQAGHNDNDPAGCGG